MPKLHGNPFKSALYEQLDQLTEDAAFWRRQFWRLHRERMLLSKQLREEAERRETIERELNALKRGNSHTIHQAEMGSDSTVPGHLTKLNCYDLTR